jgi:hypothetical protein
MLRAPAQLRRMIADLVITVLTVFAVSLLASYAVCRVSSRADELTDEHAKRATSRDWP